MSLNHVHERRVDRGDDCFGIFHDVGRDFDVLAVGLQLDNPELKLQGLGFRVVCCIVCCVFLCFFLLGFERVVIWLKGRGLSH